MMRFRKRWLAKINIAFTNRITGLFAGWLPGFGILTHVGRKSRKVYRTKAAAARVTIRPMDDLIWFDIGFPALHFRVSSGYAENVMKVPRDWVRHNDCNQVALKTPWQGQLTTNQRRCHVTMAFRTFQHP
jgi:hypothetical protein